MGGGRKKGKDKKPAEEKDGVTEKLSELQIGDASTSQKEDKSEPPPAAEEEEGLGLGGGGKKRKPRKKPAATASDKPKPVHSGDPLTAPTAHLETSQSAPSQPGAREDPRFAGQTGPAQIHPSAAPYSEQHTHSRPIPGVVHFPGQPGNSGQWTQQPAHMPGQPTPITPQGMPFPGQPGPPGYPGQMPQQQIQSGRWPGPQAHLSHTHPQGPHFPGQPHMPTHPGSMLGQSSYPGTTGQMRPMSGPPGFTGPQGMVPMQGPQQGMVPMQGPQGMVTMQRPQGMVPMQGPQGMQFPGQSLPPGFQQTPMAGPPTQMAPAPVFPPTLAGEEDPPLTGATKKSRGGRGKGKTPEATSSAHEPSQGALPPAQSASKSAPPSTPQSSASGATPLPQAAGDASASSQQVSKYRIPDRIRGNSVMMTPYNVITNYLSMTLKAMKIYRYDVAVEPDKPKKYLGRVFQAAIKNLFPGHIVAYDQMKNCYCVKPFPKVTKTDKVSVKVEVKDDNGKIMKFEVSLKSTGVVDSGTILEYMKSGTSLSPPTEAIQCIDVVLRQGTLESYVKAGRQFFKRPAAPIDLGDGMEMWTGLFQSAIFTSKAFINIDVAHKGFPIQQPLINLVNSMRLDPRRSLKEQPGRNLDNFKGFLKGLKVTAYVGGKGQVPVKREFIVNDIVEPPSKITFEFTDPSGRKRPMTVAEYFAKEKGVRLQYPNLNCLWVGPRDKKIFYPLEMLEVSYGQVRNRQLNDIQLSNMVRQAATPPDQRKKKIEEVIACMNYTNNTFFKAFGLEISNQFTPVQGKLIPVPKLDCGSKIPANPSKGQWKADRVLEGSSLNNWGIIGVELDPNAANANEIIQLFQGVGRQMGIDVSKPVLSEFNVSSRGGRLEGVMRDAFSRKLQLLLVVINTRSKDLYSQVKTMAERNVGVLTQCLKDQTAQRRMNPQTARNILLKVNSKLMGVNQALSAETMPTCLKGGPFMVVGADVTHPSPDQTNIPSIAAVTASIDKRCYKYNIEFSIQTPKKEMIVEFEDMMVDHLLLFKKTLKCLPKKIYVFRDGVSEGQFAEVMHSELRAVYNAFSRVSGLPDKPQVLFMLVQKRHHTRFFLPKSPANVEPGTVVDKDIVHPRELDFYLVSHQAIKGTARPTRYHAVCNDGAWKDDEVEQLAFYLCHLYARCTRSVSYPTPTYYAHLACMRARALTMNDTFDNAQLEIQPKRLHIKENLHEISPMFFV